MIQSMTTPTIFPEEHLSEMDQDCSSMEGPPTPRWMRDMILYELYVRDFSPEGTFRGAIRYLDRIRNLGATDVWLMPIHPIGKLGRKGSLGCPYAIQDYLRVNPEYGTAEDFRDLVTEVHRRGMRIFIDMVANHVSNDNINLSLHPEWFYRDSQGKFTRRYTEWSDVTDNNYHSCELRNFMKHVMTYWVKEFDIDGFRCDVAGMVPLDFWEEVTDSLRKIKPELYMLAEWDVRPPLCVKAFQSDYNGDVYRRLQTTAMRRGGASEIIGEFIRLRAKYPKNYLPLNFIENHDQQPAVAVFGPEGYRPWAGFIFSVPGVPLIYNGQEIGHTGYYSLFDQDPVDWQHTDVEVYDYYRALIEFRKKYRAVRDGVVVPFDVENPEMTAAYGVKLDNEALVCVLNVSSIPRDVMVKLPDTSWKPGQMVFPEQAETGNLKFSDNTLIVPVPAHSFIALK